MPPVGRNLFLKSPHRHCRHKGKRHGDRLALADLAMSQLIKIKTTRRRVACSDPLRWRIKS